MPLLTTPMPGMSCTSAGHVLKISVITDVFPTVQKAIAAVLEYDQEIDSAALSPDDFIVTDQFTTALYPIPAARVNGGVIYSKRTITRAYANDKPETNSTWKNGRYVILELDSEDEAAPCLYLTGDHRACRAHIKPTQLIIRQTAPVFGVNGSVLLTDIPCRSSAVVNRITDDFISGEFEGLKYTLYIPKDYDGSQSYPLVQFIADSWGLGDDSRISLAQGLGGVIWARPEEQAIRPCFVLVPQFPGPTIVEDDYSVSPALETAKRLLDFIISTYNVDRQRLYYTGQSMGYLSGCELNIRYPNLFAGSLLISGFWNPKTMSALNNQNIWMLISAGDGHAYGVMSSAIRNMEASGADIGRYLWDAREGPESINEKIRSAMADGHRIRYSVFQAGSVLSDEMPVNDHRANWVFCYQLEALREWLFAQKLPEQH